MKPKTMNWTRRLLGLSLLGLAWPLTGTLEILSAPAHAAEKPQPLKVGQTGQATLEANESKDYSVSLGKGNYRIVWDAKRVDERSSNIIGRIRLLKPNGVVINSSLLTFNEIALAHRVGTTLSVPKPFVARFRIENSDAYENWFTVVPVNPARRVPFGWGAKVTPARISSDNGVGGTIEKDQSLYHSITLPKGKWSISLGLERIDGSSSNLLGSIEMLDALGFKTKRLLSLNEIGTQARQEGIVTVTKPTPVLLRVTAEQDYKYDVTIEPAS